MSWIDKFRKKYKFPYTPFQRSSRWAKLYNTFFLRKVENQLNDWNVDIEEYLESPDYVIRDFSGVIGADTFNSGEKGMSYGYISATTLEQEGYDPNKEEIVGIVFLETGFTRGDQRFAPQGWVLRRDSSGEHIVIVVQDFYKALEQAAPIQNVWSTGTNAYGGITGISTNRYSISAVNCPWSARVLFHRKRERFVDDIPNV